MTDLTPIKTLIVDALNATAVIKEKRQASYGAVRDIIGISGDPYLWQDYDGTALATVILSGILDPEKVRAALIEAFEAAGLDADFLRYDVTRDVAATTITYRSDGSVEGFSTEFNENLAPAAQSVVLIDRLIASLAGGPQ